MSSERDQLRAHIEELTGGIQVADLLGHAEIAANLRKSREIAETDLLCSRSGDIRTRGHTQLTP